MVHRQQVVFPHRVEHVQDDVALQPANFGAVAVFDGAVELLLQLLAVELGEKLLAASRSPAAPAASRSSELMAPLPPVAMRTVA